MIQLRTVWGQKFEHKIGFMVIKPLLKGFCMMEPCIINNYDHDRIFCPVFMQLFKESFDALRIKFFFFLGNKFPLACLHGPDDSNFFSRGFVPDNGIFDIPRKPSSQPRSMLLKMALIHKPDIECFIHGELKHFF